MTAVNQYAPMNSRLVDEQGRATAAFQIWMREIWLRTGGATGAQQFAGASFAGLFDAPADGEQGMPGPRGQQGEPGQAGQVLWIQADEPDDTPVFYVINP